MDRFNQPGLRVNTLAAAASLLVALLLFFVTDVFALLEQLLYTTVQSWKPLDAGIPGDVVKPSIWVLLLGALPVVLWWPVLELGRTVLIATISIVSLLVLQVVGWMTGQLWLPLMAAIMMLFLGLVSQVISQFASPEDRQNRQLLKQGIALQEEGQLEPAFELLRQCPLDPPLMDRLYRLAQAFEVRQQLIMARKVFEHIASHDPEYRDLPRRLARQKPAITIPKSMPTVSATPVSAPISTPYASPVVTAIPRVSQLGRYQVERELGKGSMGIVFQGRDAENGQVVALKTMALSDEFEASDLTDARARFFREAETAGRLKHPHIVAVYDTGEDHGLAYIAMEFLNGHDLNRYASANTLLPVERVLEYIADAADALHYAHKQNIIHRDIKPANLMLNEDGKLKVTDFGIARITDSSRTRTGLVLGSPSFMSPEQLAGKKLDGRADIYSLGVTLFQLLTGELPFKGKSLAQLMGAIANEIPPLITEYRQDMPVPLVRLVERCLAKTPDLRYETAADMAEALRNCRNKMMRKA
ncbi:serine/threonine-protein kinase [Chitinivorax sp. B]|uniref:serine/threonine-protein kinase n=1 Tax=Chitinivorax sp. B TaxID=2502235 RepID=UPI0014858B45|nr:serine/threonine-protein kinase [Chitinivorax sp. B]